MKCRLGSALCTTTPQTCSSIRSYTYFESILYDPLIFMGSKWLLQHCLIWVSREDERYRNSTFYTRKQYLPLRLSYQFFTFSLWKDRKTKQSFSIFMKSKRSQNFLDIDRALEQWMKILVPLAERLRPFFEIVVTLVPFFETVGVLCRNDQFDRAN